MSNKSTINPESVFNSTQFGFSQAVRVNSGELIFISGQVAWDENLELIGLNDLNTQTRQALKNLASVVSSAGGSINDIAMLRIYKVDYQSQDSAIIRKQLMKLLGPDLPAMSLIGVQALANPGFLIEIEAQAVISI